jgi:DNA-binding CsgD family transcriptional regulator
LLSLTSEQVYGLVHQDERESTWDNYNARLNGEKAPIAHVQFRSIRKDGSTCWIEAYSNVIDYGGRPANLSTFIDITKRKDALHLLIEKSEKLQETNAALKVLLKQREKDKIELEDKLLLNIKETVFPYVEKLKRPNPTPEQDNYLNIIRSNLNDMSSPLIRTLSSRFLGFTPSEMQIANLSKQGKTVKEIAELLNLATGTIKCHRNSIRKKLGISNKKINLRTHLLSLQ